MDYLQYKILVLNGHYSSVLDPDQEYFPKKLYDVLTKIGHKTFLRNKVINEYGFVSIIIKKYMIWSKSKSKILLSKAIKKYLGSAL